ncbi:MAG: hypothetical protein ACOC2Y_03255 [Spirochaetota bacterium]
MSNGTDVFNDELAAPGFIKTSRRQGPELSAEQRSALIRRGNELFNKGSIDQAKRVFITTRYTDGLIRIGDYYMKKNQPLEAFRMYWLAPERRKSDYLIERMAGVVRGWLKETGDE